MFNLKYYYIGVKESKQDETPQTDDKSNQDQTISDYILENKMLLMKIGKLQSEVNKKCTLKKYLKIIIIYSTKYFYIMALLYHYIQL